MIPRTFNHYTLSEAISEDIVLVSDERGAEQCYYIMLAKMMVNMLSEQMKVNYMGELKV